MKIDELEERKQELMKSADTELKEQEERHKRELEAIENESHQSISQI